MIQSQSEVDGPRDLDHATVPPDGRPLADQPKWRQDFPIDWAQDEYVSRRELVKFIVLTSAALTVGQFWIVLKSAFSRQPARLAGERIASVDELSVGGAKTFTYPEGSTPRLLVRTGTTDVRRLRPAVHAPSLPGGARGRTRPAALPLPQWLVRPPHRPAPRGPAAARSPESPAGGA